MSFQNQARAQTGPVYSMMYIPASWRVWLSPKRQEFSPDFERMYGVANTTGTPTISPSVWSGRCEAHGMRWLMP
jgi:hypothetical protein